MRNGFGIFTTHQDESSLLLPQQSNKFLHRASHCQVFIWKSISYISVSLLLSWEYVPSEAFNLKYSMHLWKRNNAHGPQPCCFLLPGLCTPLKLRGTLFFHDSSQHPHELTVDILRIKQHKHLRVPQRINEQLFAFSMQLQSSSTQLYHSITSSFP